jgi:hypothetical protein
MGLLLASCAEVAPIPFTSLEGNWAPRGATCDETSLYFQFHEGLAQRLARYEPASDLLFHYKKPAYVAPTEGQSKGLLSLEVNKSSKEQSAPGWETWVFTYHMNSRLSLHSIDGKVIDKAAQRELAKRFSLEKCTTDQLYAIEGKRSAGTENEGKRSAGTENEDKQSADAKPEQSETVSAPTSN